jgi:hypothetical protein
MAKKRSENVDNARINRGKETNLLDDKWTRRGFRT